MRCIHDSMTVAVSTVSQYIMLAKIINSKLEGGGRDVRGNVRDEVRTLKD
jgi:hypothetical protein